MQINDQKPQKNILLGSGRENVDRVYSQLIPRLLHDRCTVNFTIIEKVSTKEILKACKNHPFDLFMVLLNSIRTDGTFGQHLDRVEEVLKLIRYLKKTYEKPIIGFFIWGFEDPEIGEKVTEAGVDYYCFLPCDLQKLCDAMIECFSI
ncbi:hypothetical protein ACFL4L_02715 [bacterium]